MDDYRAFLLATADDFRERNSRTLVARRAYDGIAARLQALANAPLSDEARREEPALLEQG